MLQGQVQMEWIDTQAALLQVLEEATAAPRLALDLEANGLFRFRARPCIMQLADGERILGIDIIALGLDLLPGLDVFVLSSRYEGLPISMLEAMAAEVACVLTRVGGIAEAVADGREGLLVPAAAPEALAWAIGQVLEDPDLRRRLGTAARERVQRDFSIDRAVRTLEERYTTLLTRSGAGSSAS